MVSDYLWDEKAELFNDIFNTLDLKLNEGEMIEIKNKIVKYEQKLIEWDRAFRSENKTY